VGNEAGMPRGGRRLDLLATLRAAAPWQRLRSAERPVGADPTMLLVRGSDLRVRRLAQRVGTTMMVAVDASGSAAAQRLGEAKGAVELLLAESYVRRDQVALVSFRGKAAELILPPTRSLARAKRTLAGLPGGGGTPLAAALSALVELGCKVRRDGGRPLGVMLTDGRANVALDGTGGRPRAEAEARRAARQVAAAGIPLLILDTGARPNPALQEIARLADADYLPLPNARADRVRDAVRATSDRRPAA
jgi:magnesium chelatase subunit D